MPANIPRRGPPLDGNAVKTSKRRLTERVRSMGKIVAHHLRSHTGVGIVCAVAYFDPGNWGVDLQAGSQYGYRLLFVVLLAGIFAVFLQVLASRLGCVTGLDLASHCRLLLHSRPKHRLLYRWIGLYPLYVLAEVAIIATDLAELLGSAIALCMLFPKLQLWHGVLITAFDVFILLLFGDPLRGRPVRMFEFIIAGLRGDEVPASLFDAYDLIRNLVGQGAATLFAVALLAAGQSSSIICTVAGQAVSEGFLQWRTSPALRRIITRLIAIVPSMVVAIAVGRPGIDALLVISQVVLSIVLPFIMVPLIYCTSSKSVMSVRKTRDDDPPSTPSDTALRVMSPCQIEDAEPDEMVDFSSGWFATGIGAMICLIVAAANVYVITSLARGSHG
ncbi:hypothetical protein C0992_009537 [Termitomyces sp. T32_za158]|nr:hypothetical protein C0992_009537 [Termitomyces sp. T32_za158]